MSCEKNMMDVQNRVPTSAAGEEQEMRMDVRELFYRLVEKAWIIILTAVIAASAVGLYTHFFMPDSYTATAKLYVIGGEDTVINLSALNLGDELAEDYVQVFQNRDVYNYVQQGFPAAYGYELPYSFNEIQEQLKVTQLNDTRILKISFTCSNPDEALNVVEAYLKTAQSFMDTRMGTSLPKQAFESPYVSPYPTGPNLLRNMVLAFIIAALLTLTVVVCQFIFDDRIRTPDQLEKRLGLPTLGLMPMQESDIRRHKRGRNK